MITLKSAKTVTDGPKLSGVLLFPVMPSDPLPHKIIDYNFSSLKLSNPGGKMPAIVKNCKLGTGPGETIMGHLPHSFDMGQNGFITADISKSITNTKLFAVRICFLAPHYVTHRQELVTSTQIPFTIHLDKTTGIDEFKLVANVHTVDYDWAGFDTGHTHTLHSGKWYVADLVYSVDTLSLFVNGHLVGVNAFPKGNFNAPTGGLVIAGVGEDTKSYKFTGKIAGLQLHYKLPHVLLPQADESRDTPEWFIANKAMAVGKSILGSRVGKQAYWPLLSVYTQNFEHGQVQYSPVLGVAYEMHGEIWRYYNQLPDAEKQALGFLVSDGTVVPGATGYKNLFRQGGIYFSLGNVSINHVTGQIYRDYIKLGEIVKLGYPTTNAIQINGGIKQQFEGNDIYLKDGAASGFAVCGPMLTCYNTAGGADVMGFPTANYTPVILKGNNTDWFVSRFENGIIYWTENKGAFNLLGDIAKKYKDSGEASGSLGFPTSVPTKIAGPANVTYNTFENGSIVTLASGTFTCTPFQIFLKSIDTEGQDNLSENDLTIDAYIRGLPSGDYHQRFPDGNGYYKNTNNVDIDTSLDYVVIPNNHSLNIKLEADVWDIDDGANDPIGTYFSEPLNIYNAWGFADNNGVFKGGVDYIKSLVWSVRHNVDITTLKDSQRWWGMHNGHIDSLSYLQFSEAFTDVSYPFEFYDPRQWFDGLFYELFVKHIAQPGFCCGMCIEAVLAWKNNSLYSLPLSDYTTLDDIMREQFALLHARQASSAVVLWEVEQFMSGNTHSPKSVFAETQDLFDSGQNPVIGITQNYCFGGTPHILLPYDWHKEGNIWYIKVYDPNVKVKPDNDDATSQHIEINANEGVNSFTYNPKGGPNYSGNAWSGGRFYYLPWSTIAERSGTPGDDFMNLFSASHIIFGGSDGSTESITDTHGNSLDLNSPWVTSLLKNGESVDHCFFPFRPANDDTYPNYSPLYVRKGLVSDNPAAGTPYIHKIKATANGTFNYASKNILTEVLLQADTAVGEIMTVTVKYAQTMQHALSLQVEKDRVVTVNVVNKYPDGNSCIRLQFDIPVRAERHLMLNLRPGLSGLDIMADKDAFKTTITATAVLNGRAPVVTKYGVEIKGGVRIRHSTLATAGELLLSKIDTLLGPARDLQILKGINVNI